MFDLPFGPMDPRLLTELLRQQMASPGQVPGPVPTVELKPGYRPPSGAMAGMSEAQPVPGFNIKSGLAAIEEGLSGWKPKTGKTDSDPYGRTKNDADLAGYGVSPPLDAYGNPMALPSPNAPQWDWLDFLDRKWKENFRA